jgi:photosystem II stability/assembly factor-like uncharacterized protein
VSQQGRTWPVAGEPFFLNAELGWRLDDGGQLMQTRDGGQIWTLLKQVAWAKTAFSFVDEKTGWALVSADAATWQPTLVYTTDGGLTWQEIKPVGDDW